MSRAAMMLACVFAGCATDPSGRELTEFEAAPMRPPSAVIAVALEAFVKRDLLNDATIPRVGGHRIRIMSLKNIELSCQELPTGSGWVFVPAGEVEALARDLGVFASGQVDYFKRDGNRWRVWVGMCTQTSPDGRTPRASDLLFTVEQAGDDAVIVDTEFFIG